MGCAVTPLAACVAALTIATGVTWPYSVAQVALASERLSLVLNLRLTCTDGLPDTTRRALMTEAESIWKPGHIQLRWLGERAEADERETLHVLVAARPVAASEHSPWTVAELLQPEGSRPVAIASTAGAQRIIDESEWNQILTPAALREYRLGVVLGRAVAHEIGHYMLRTNTHATRGLMRARIASREFADLRSGTFYLDKAAETHMALLAAQGTSPHEPRPGFSYPAR